MPAVTIAPLQVDDLDDLLDLEPADHAALLAHLRWALSTPYAIALKAVFGEALICGVATATAHASSGWLGERIVHPHFRQGDVEALLARSLIARLNGRGCTAVSAISEPAQQSFYQAVGLFEASRYWHYTGGHCEPPTMDEVVLFEPQHTLGVLHLDGKASGEDRRAMISEHLYAGRVFVRKGEVLGAYLPLLGEGFICASTPRAGLELLRWHLMDAHSVFVPDTNIAALNFLMRRNYSLTGEVLRMHSGTRLRWRPAMVFARAGAWLG